MRNKTILAATICFVLCLFLSAPVFPGEGSKHSVKYPEGYRQWTHVKSMVIQQGHPLFESFGGIHHVYANKKALEAMKTGKSYPNGAVLVFDLLEAKSENSATVEGLRKIIGVMEKDSRRFAQTGGWGFEGFKNDTRERAVADPKGACFGCHEPQKKTDYVFSSYRK